MEGQQAIKNLINQVDNRVREEASKANLPSQKLGVKNLAMIGDSVLELKSFAAQAFDGKSFLPRERCWRCRLTFGFTWLWPEGHPKGLSVAKIKDFELRWDNTSDTRKDGEGKFAEYILWWNTIAKMTQNQYPHPHLFLLEPSQIPDVAQASSKPYSTRRLHAQTQERSPQYSESKAQDNRRKYRGGLGGPRIPRNYQSKAQSISGEAMRKAKAKERTVLISLLKTIIFSQLLSFNMNSLI